jgi:puromycin-sensitive aminopeptidase
MSLTPADRNFRLPEGVRPRRYDAFLSVEPEARAFTGRIRIALDLAAAREALVVHGAGLRVKRAVVRAGGTERLAEVETFAASETLVLRPPGPVPAGAVEVELEWGGEFSSGLRGLYRAGPLAATQFEAADARRVFPCLDEPGF